MKTLLKAIGERVLVSLIVAAVLAIPVKTLFFNTVEKLRGVLWQGESASVEVTEIESFVNLAFLVEGAKPDSPTDYDLIRSDKSAEKVFSPSFLKGRRIVGISWIPIDNIGSFKDFGSLKYSSFEDRMIKVEASTNSSVAVRFKILVYHVVTP